eukprot:355145-Chlamydomonas_euryale.AAC.1
MLGSELGASQQTDAMIASTQASKVWGHAGAHGTLHTHERTGGCRAPGRMEVPAVVSCCLACTGHLAQVSRCGTAGLGGRGRMARVGGSMGDAMYGAHGRTERGHASKGLRLGGWECAADVSLCVPPRRTPPTPPTSQQMQTPRDDASRISNDSHWLGSGLLRPGRTVRASAPLQPSGDAARRSPSNSSGGGGGGGGTLRHSSPAVEMATLQTGRSSSDSGASL